MKRILAVGEVGDCVNVWASLRRSYFRWAVNWRTKVLDKARDFQELLGGKKGSSVWFYRAP